MPTCTSPPRWIPSAACSASGSSRPRRPVMPGCWTGWPGSGPCAWSVSRGPAATAPAWPGTCATAGVRVVEVDRSDRQDRRRQGKSDPLDAVSAARAAQSGRARGAPKGRDGAVEAIRALMVARRSAAGERTRAINQARALVLTGPDDLRARFTRQTPAALVAGIARLRPRPGDVVGYATRVALRELGRRAEFLRRPARAPGRAHRPPGHRPRPGPAQPCTGSAPTLPRCCSSPPGTTPDGCAPRPPGRTCAPPPRSPHPRGNHPPPAQPRRRPPGQPRPVADRVHPDGLGPGHPRLRRAAHERKESPRQRSSAA